MKQRTSGGGRGLPKVPVARARLLPHDRGMGTATWWRVLAASGLVVVAACGAACWGKPESARGPTPTRYGKTDGGTFEVAWEPVPDPIPLNAMFSVRLRVTEAAPTSPSSPADLEIDVDAGMPGHGHGMNVKPRVTALEGGGFEARGFLFHMPGRWELTVKVKRGATTELARFPVDVE